jgi:hypothetical protein
VPRTKSAAFWTGPRFWRLIQEDIDGKRWLRDVSFHYTDDLATTLVCTVMTGILAQRPTISRAQHMKTARKPCWERKND